VISTPFVRLQVAGMQNGTALRYHVWYVRIPRNHATAHGHSRIPATTKYHGPTTFVMVFMRTLVPPAQPKPVTVAGPDAVRVAESVAASFRASRIQGALRVVRETRNANRRWVRAIRVRRDGATVSGRAVVCARAHVPAPVSKQRDVALFGAAKYRAPLPPSPAVGGEQPPSVVQPLAESDEFKAHTVVQPAMRGDEHGTIRPVRDLERFGQGLPASVISSLDKIPLEIITEGSTPPVPTGKLF
jgi:hypothetical protein